MKILALLPVCVLLGAQVPKTVSKDAARVLLFQATPAIYKPGQPVELRWVTSGVENVRIEPMNEEQPPLGKMTVIPDGKTVYWIHAYNDHGGESLPVEVEPLRPVKVFAPGDGDGVEPALKTPVLTAASKPAPDIKLESKPDAPRSAPTPIATPIASPEAKPIPTPAPAPTSAPASALPSLPSNAKPVIAVRTGKHQVVEAPGRLADLPALENGTVESPLASPQSGLSKVAPYVAAKAEKERDTAVNPPASTNAQAKGIWIQFIALFNAESAQSVKSQLEQSTGHSVTIAQAPSNGQTVNRIRMGPFSNRKDAFARMREVRAKALSMELNPQMIFE